MALRVRGPADKALKQICQALAKYEVAHPKAEIDIYRHGSVSIHIRIVDPDFNGISRADRHDQVWELFEPLTEGVQSQITLLLLLTPKEKKRSYADVEFDHPVGTGL